MDALIATLVDEYRQRMAAFGEDGEQHGNGGHYGESGSSDADGN